MKIAFWIVLVLAFICFFASFDPEAVADGRAGTYRIMAGVVGFLALGLGWLSTKEKPPL